MAHILVIDDDVAMTKLLKTLLELDGFTVDTASRASDAVRVANAHRPDLFLLDYHLPDMDGTELIKILRADHGFPDTPMVVLSGRYVEPEVMAAGGTGFVLKPYDTSELTALMRRLIQG
ncbi:MAG: response regulator [Anaerolineae bacterium]|jgi:two-component system KDP operon response regulator KdpE|nr:response regulator [Anaerolineae bacterium]